MILECPNCETCYEIPQDLPPEGRKVRCASCQHVWNATPENQPKSDVAADIFDDGEIVFKNDDDIAEEPSDDAGNSQDSIDDMFAQDNEAGEAPQEGDEDAGNSQGSVDDIFAMDTGEEDTPETPDTEEKPSEAEAAVEEDTFAKPEDDTPEKAAESDASDDEFSESAMEEAFSSVIKEADTAAESASEDDTQEAESPPIVIGKARKRRRFVPGNIAAGWAALAIIMGGATSYVYYGRISVVRILPGAATTYERLGLPVNVRGLEFDKVKYSWETSAGRPVLEVYGDIINVTSEPLRVPTVVFGLRTKEKVEVYQWAADVRSELLPGGQRTAFSAQIPTPPKSIRDVQIRFAKVR